MQRSWNSYSVCVCGNCIIINKQVSNQIFSCWFSTWNVECLPSGLMSRWSLTCWVQNCDEGKRTMCHSVLVPLPISVQLHCILFHKPSCKDQTRFKNTFSKINLLLQWLKKPFLHTNLKNTCVIYVTHEKNFLPIHTFFLQSRSNNSSICHLLAQQPFLAKTASLPCLRYSCIPSLENHLLRWNHSQDVAGHSKC